jgi:DNA-binding MarR family transcriptional regulator
MGGWHPSIDRCIYASMGTRSTSLWAALGTFRRRVLDRVQKRLVAMPGMDLGIPQSLVLFQVAEKGPLTIGEIQAALGRSQATTSHLVSQLERRSLVERIDDPEDARRTRVRLSAKGRGLVQRVETMRERGFEEVLGSLPAATRRRLEDALVETIEALDAASKEEP